MSEKPQEVLSDDLLEQIIAQGLEKITAPAQAAAAEEAPPEIAPSASGREGGVEDSPPTDRKRRQSAVYLYLLVLFGAAFLMLLLAFFIQQRSSEDTISDLRDSMNLSREELLAQIKALEEENEALNVDLSILQRRYDEQTKSTNGVINQLLDDTQEALYSWEQLWRLEQYYQTGDLEACAAILIFKDQDQYSYSTPDAAQKRYDEIVRAVFDAGILDEDYEGHLNDYRELVETYISRSKESIEAGNG